MTRPNPKKQKVARDQLKSIFMDASNVCIIHYSCENFYNRPHGASPRITSIAVRKIKSGQTISFSIHQVAERQKVSFDQIGDHYDFLERAMLDEFFIHVGSHRGMKYLHWNMRDINFGFAAIEHRYKVPDGIPVVEDYDKRSLEDQLQALGFTPTIYSPAYVLIDADKIKVCHQKNIKVIPWTVNDAATITQLKNLGVDGIISDFPDMF